MADDGTKQVAPLASPGSAPQELEPKLLAYVDILGFKEQITADIVGAVKAIGALGAVSKLEQTRKGWFSKGGLTFGETNQTSTFSDTIVFSCKPNPDDAGVLLLNVQMLCVFLLRKGSYTRGAITVGGLFHQDSTIIGKALIEAHALEQQIAKYPRIVVTDGGCRTSEVHPDRQRHAEWPLSAPNRLRRIADSGHVRLCTQWDEIAGDP
jgi:hypothetical protein